MSEGREGSAPQPSQVRGAGKLLRKHTEITATISTNITYSTTTSTATTNTTNTIYNFFNFDTRILI